MRLLLLLLTALSLTWSSTSLAYAKIGEPCAREARASGARAQEEVAKGPLVYAQARYLDPNTGRFLSLDPLSGALREPLSTQGFIYGRASPTSFTDPDGRQDIGTLFVGATMQRKARECGPNGSALGCASANASENMLLGATTGAALSAPCLLAPEACLVALGAGLLTSGAPTLALAEEAATSTMACFSEDVLAMTDDELASCQMLAGGLLAAGPEMAFGAAEGTLATHQLLRRFVAAGSRSEVEAAAVALGISRWAVRDGADGDALLSVAINNETGKIVALQVDGSWVRHRSLSGAANGPTPVKRGEVTTYRDAEDRKVLFDDLEAHELWQHANMNENDLVGAHRLEDAASEMNPVIMLTRADHARVTALQLRMDARKVTPVQNIRYGAQILRDLEVASTEAINELETAALEHAARMGFK